MYTDRLTPTVSTQSRRRNRAGLAAAMGASMAIGALSSYGANAAENNVQPICVLHEDDSHTATDLDRQVIAAGDLVHTMRVEDQPAVRTIRNGEIVLAPGRVIFDHVAPLACLRTQVQLVPGDGANEATTPMPDPRLADSRTTTIEA